MDTDTVSQSTEETELRTILHLYNTINLRYSGSIYGPNAALTRANNKLVFGTK